MNDLKSYFGHKEGCLCTRCMEADMDSFIETELGLDPAKYKNDKPHGELPRAISSAGERATTAQVVRPITEPQKKKIAMLADERDLRQLPKLWKDRLGKFETLSCKTASALIDTLIKLNVVQGKERPASDKQRGALVREAERRNLNGQDADLIKFICARALDAKSGKPVSFKDAHSALGVLFTLPLVEAKTQVTRVDDGFYLYKNQVYRVQTSKSSGFPYAQCLNPETGKFEMARGVIFQLKPGMALSLDQACKLGVKWNRCVVCGAELTNPESVAAGIGPVCRGKL